MKVIYFAVFSHFSPLLQMLLTVKQAYLLVARQETRARKLAEHIKCMFLQLFIVTAT